MQIVPLPASYGPLAPRRASRSVLQPVLGSLYIVLSILCSCMYIVLLQPSTSNDIWWANYTTSTDQALVIDLFNALLAVQSSGLIDILAPHASVDKPYATSIPAVTSLHPARPRRLATTELTTLDYAVVNLRTLDPLELGWMGTQYCWVDFARRFEVAHTRGRQRRCLMRYKSNGAVYLEAVLRNQNWDDLIGHLGGDGGLLSTAILDWLDVTADGRAWLASTSAARATTTVDGEVLYWTSHAITSFTLQWQNDFVTGLTDVLVVENAVGISFDVLLSRMPSKDVTWTSIVLYCAFVNDMYFMQLFNRSMIWSANNSFFDSPPMSYEQGLGLTDAETNEDATVSVTAFRAWIGPFVAVDTWVIPAPPSAVNMYRDFYAVVRSAVGANYAIDAAMSALPGGLLSPTPLEWSDPAWSFLGGNPMCLHGEPLPFVQQTFGFEDTCDQQVPLTFEVTQTGALFGVLAMKQYKSSVEACTLNENVLSCDARMNAWTQVGGMITSRLAQVDQVLQDVQAVNVGIMQFAARTDWLNDMSGTVLFQRLLDGSAFDFYSWVMLMDWVEGKREVVRFDGDVQSMTLISMCNTPVTLGTNATYVTSVSRGVRFLAGYVSLVLALVGASCVFSTCVAFLQRSKTSPNLLWFNHVVGAVWVGRPLLLLRGATAVVFLSTAQLHVATTTTPSGHSSRFELARLSWIETGILAGEASWLLYVAADYLTILSRRFTRAYAPVAYALAWALLVCLERWSPVLPVAWTRLMCAAQDMDQALSCSSGVLQVGSYRRVWAILIVQAASLVAGLVVATLAPELVAPTDKRSRHPPHPSSRHVLSVADSLFFPGEKSMAAAATLGTFKMTTIPSHDDASWLMAGLVPIPWLTDAYFDIKVWLLHAKTRPAPYKTIQPRQHATIVGHSRRGHQLRLVLGLLYVVVSSGCSLLYVQLSQTNLQNDLFWANYNMSGVHTFIATWLNEQLVLGTHNATILLDSGEVIDDRQYDQMDSQVISAPNGGASLQYADLSTIDAMISGLRTTDACGAPWIFTPYCYVDFDRRWELANTAARQRRCISMASNGAVFLESILRNVDYAKFYRCWGPAFDLAIAADMSRTNDGRGWLAMVSATTKLSVADEIRVWQRYGIDRFATQWQNFKTIGFDNEYSVTNAFAMAHAFELASECWAFRFERETTLKMYWAFANDLAGVYVNESAIHGGGLIRASPAFAFENKSLEAVLLDEAILIAPLTAAYSVVRSEIGPFGSIDMTYIACPSSVKTALRAIFAALSRSLAKNYSAQQAYTAVPSGINSIRPVPPAWTNGDFTTHGGSILCPDTHPNPFSSGLLEFTALYKQCSAVPIFAMMSFDRRHVVAAAVLSNTTLAEDVARTCIMALAATDASCVNILSASVAFAGDVLAPLLPVEMAAMVSAATQHVLALDVELIQFGTLSDTSPMTLLRMSVLDPEFAFFGWSFLIDWALGYRDVVQFAGDRGNVTVLTEYEQPVKQPVNLAESPQFLSKYLERGVWYSTTTSVLVAVLVFVYLVLSAGNVEAVNMFEFQRVGGIVWIGRPLLLSRCVSALGLLASASLELRHADQMTFIDTVPVPWFKTVLAANEITWCVAILSDIAVVATQEYTQYYATINSVLVAVVAATLSTAWPVRHSMTIDRQCRVAHVDFQILCTSGTIAIGESSRVAMLVFGVLAYNALCYVVARQIVSKPRPTPVKSVFLYAGAKYMFTSAAWVDDDTYYMDRMSAAMNGILSLRYGNVMYGLDIKLWCTFQADVRTTDAIPKAHQLAIPLRLTNDY